MKGIRRLSNSDKFGYTVMLLSAITTIALFLTGVWTVSLIWMIVAIAFAMLWVAVGLTGDMRENDMIDTIQELVTIGESIAENNKALIVQNNKLNEENTELLEAVHAANEALERIHARATQINNIVGGDQAGGDIVKS